ncbi:hypothetical protein HN51_007884 [Arachis hypogaea]|uniref:B3 domain-containing transcription factor VRN1-like n=1 Tax=Arachis duranensis TaxID=130453 RepID=A0A6P4DG37_ARADU|nr:B3 domain-containing transcription factor VRN1-like [Arachis duranensis]XP_025697530.1 B3 domain-containing transcription factor VRN1 [Arachis hypogaea]QHO42119.1 B3 domain-containing protein [Arachis hypogaea]
MAIHQQREHTSVVSFFKIICRWHILDEKIKLPTEFTNKCGLKLPNPVILKVVDGNQKKVHWTKINGSIWFIGKEWKEFLENYSVSHGHLLLFKYCLVASCFGVQIFDSTTLEIDYPYHELNYDDYEDYYEDDDDEDVVDVVKLQYDQYQLKDKSESIADAIRSDRLERKDSNPSFEVVMQDSYINGGRCMAVPSNFAREYMKEGGYLLRVADGRTWKVMYKTWSGDGMPCKKCKLQKGWAKFSQGNKLEKDDVCVFELVNNNCNGSCSTIIPTFNVLIHRNHIGSSY